MLGERENKLDEEELEEQSCLERVNKMFISETEGNLCLLKTWTEVMERLWVEYLRFLAIPGLGSGRSYPILSSGFLRAQITL